MTTEVQENGKGILEILVGNGAFDSYEDAVVGIIGGRVFFDGEKMLNPTVYFGEGEYEVTVIIGQPGTFQLHQSLAVIEGSCACCGGCDVPTMREVKTVVQTVVHTTEIVTELYQN